MMLERAFDTTEYGVLQAPSKSKTNAITQKEENAG
jgi:hypothetical protein